MMYKLNNVFDCSRPIEENINYKKFWSTFRPLI